MNARIPGEIIVTVNGKISFEWSGDQEALDTLDALMRRLARQEGMEPFKLAQGMLQRVAGHGVPKSPRARRGLMNWLVWWALELPTGRPDKPGKLREYFLRSSIQVDAKVVRLPDGRWRAEPNIQVREWQEEG